MSASAQIQASPKRAVVPSGARSDRRLLGLALGSVALVWLSYQPWHCWPIAWVALVPWLVFAARACSARSAFSVGFISGAAAFLLNLWWIWKASIPGVAVLAIYLGLYWGTTAALIQRGGVLSLPAEGRSQVRTLAAVFVVALLWTAMECLRAYSIPGLTWFLLGWSQTSVPFMCQIADVTGVAGITFWLMLVNSLGAFAILHWKDRRLLILPASAVALVLLLVMGYGLFRLRQDCLSPGPAVMVVQTNHAYLRGGVPTMTREEATRRHIDLSRSALAEHHPDLIVWAEAVLPPINPEALQNLEGSATGRELREIEQAVQDLANQGSCTVMAGGMYVGGWTLQGRVHTGSDFRNCVYCFSPDRAEISRYDKTQLVLFSETMPFKSIPWLQRLALSLAPPVASQPLTPGDENNPTIFELALRNPDSQPAGSGTRPASETPGRLVHFVTPICLENLHSDYISSLVHHSEGNGKRADFLLNVSNDGWFCDQERWNHWQAIVLRCIENRVPMARSSNSGISGFLDSCGRTTELISPSTEGVSMHQLMLDSRSTFYSRHGEVFGGGCVAIAGMMIAGRFLFGRRRSER